MVPRGKYTLQMFQNYAKFHGKTHDYKIIYKDIIKMFQLPKVDRNDMVILFQLSKPLNQGQTMHHFILIQIDRSIEIELKVNLTQEQIDTQYKGKFE